MPTVEFLENDIGPGLVVDVPEGGSLADVCDANLAPIPFSCRGASCGTCRIEVLEGGEYFEAIADDEALVLAEFEDPPGRRLACQAQLRPGEGRIVLKIVED